MAELEGNVAVVISGAVIPIDGGSTHSLSS
jgi:hypothetical protein